MPLHHCSTHKDELLSWVCLEKDCKDRLLCSKCAIKVHNKSHKLEELTTLKEKGFRSLIDDENLAAKDISFNFLDLHSGLLDLERKFKSLFKEVGEKYGESTHQLYKSKEESIKLIDSKFQNLKNSDHELGYRNFNPDELSTHIEDSLNMVDDIKNPKNFDNLKLLKAKENLVNIASSSILNTLFQIHSNSVIETLINSFKSQLETITGKSLKDERVIQMIEAKWDADSQKVAAILARGFNEIKKNLQSCNDPQPQSYTVRMRTSNDPYANATPHYDHPVYQQRNVVMMPHPHSHSKQPMFMSPKLKNPVSSMLEKIEGAKMCDSQILNENNKEIKSVKKFAF